MAKSNVSSIITLTVPFKESDLRIVHDVCARHKIQCSRSLFAEPDPLGGESLVDVQLQVFHPNHLFLFAYDLGSTLRNTYDSSSSKK